MDLDDTEISVRLLAVRRQLEAAVWPTARQVALTGEREAISELVRLKVDIEAIDFALIHRPAG